MQTKLKISTACLQNSILTHTPRQYRRCHLPTGSQQRPATGVSDGEKGGIKLPGQRVPFPPFSAQARERVGTGWGGRGGSPAAPVGVLGARPARPARVGRPRAHSVPSPPLSPTPPGVHTHTRVGGARGSAGHAVCATAVAASSRAPRPRAPTRALPAAVGMGRPRDRAKPQPQPRRPPPPPRGRPRRDLRHSAARGREPERRMEQERNLPM